MKRLLVVSLAGGALAGVSFFAGEDVQAADMYRLYNPNSSEHFYTENRNESNYLRSLGWNYEGIGWIAPDSGAPVYRLYNKNTGDHHYTLSAGEKDDLIKRGWGDEGISWRSPETGLPVYRLYNPNQKGAGTHHYTLSEAERDSLKKVGWNDEGIGWYAESAAQYPYAVDLASLVGTRTFAMRGMNISDQIKVQFPALPNGQGGKLYFISRSSDGSQREIAYNIKRIDKVATKELRVFSPTNSNGQTLNHKFVNTRIQIGEKIDGVGQVDTGDLYLQYNNQGNISLITPNYAGNVTEDQRDVMLEYVIQQ